MEWLNAINGKKTYIGIGIYALSIVLGVVGVPAAVVIPMGKIGASLAGAGFTHKAAKVIEQVNELAKKW